jgi:uncharacterized SAM-binding protein YcdF (DUF218 family)
MPCSPAWWWALLAAVVAARLALAAARLAAALARPWAPADAVLILGGSSARERAALTACARTAPRSPVVGATPADRAALATAPIFVSSPEGDVEAMAGEAGVGRGRVRLDETATDTVTNLTTVLPLLPPAATRLLILTSPGHAPRARAVAWAVAGAGGGVTPAVRAVRCEGGGRPESRARVVRDALRCIVWLAVGASGARVVGRVAHPDRFRHTPRRAAAL